MEYYGTLGPACSDLASLDKMIKAGMTGIRINLSHGDLDEKIDWIENYYRACDLNDLDYQIIVDVQGPELRLGVFDDIDLKEGELIAYVGKDSLEDRAIKGPGEIIDHGQVGDLLIVDDGKVNLRVEELDENRLIVRSLTDAKVKKSKSITIKNKDIKLPILTERDLKNLKFAQSIHIKNLMQPFVRSGEELRELKKTLADHGLDGFKIYGKIENQEGIDRIEEIVTELDVLVIARGDLGNNLDIWTLPGIQKKLASVARRAGVDFMVVTQLLDSMIENPQPTRAEVNDIYNSVLDGASSLMVTAETAIGKYPIKCMEILKKTASEGIKARNDYV